MFCDQNYIIPPPSHVNSPLCGLRVDELPSGDFRLGYTLDGIEQYLALWDYVMEGDHILINTPPVSKTGFEKGIRFNFAAMLSNKQGPPLISSLETGSE